MTPSGALAGAAGAHYVLGYKHYFERDIGSGVGFMGVAVALSAGTTRSGSSIAALLFGTLSHGGLEVSEHVPKQLVEILQAVIILAVAVAAALAQRGAARGRGEDGSSRADRGAAAAAAAAGRPLARRRGPSERSPD